jgi:hypothetical protein
MPSRARSNEPDSSAGSGKTARSISISVAEALMWIDALRQTARDVDRGRAVAKELAQNELAEL